MARAYALGKPVPKTVDKGFDLSKQRSYQAFMRKKKDAWSLFESDGWCETEGYPTDSLAKFAFSILWQAVGYSGTHGTLIIFDY